MQLDLNETGQIASAVGIISLHAKLIYKKKLSGQITHVDLTASHPKD